jgi:chaperonin GroEL
MSKQVTLGSEARKKLTEGINKVADAISSTLGPSGRNIIYVENGEVLSTKDGVSVAKSISDLEDPIENLGAQMIKQASIKTATKSGDGTTTSTLLAQVITNEGLAALDKGANAVEVKRGIDEAVKEVVEFIKTNISKDISSAEQITQIATISANNDPEIGNLISAALEKVGREGVVHIEESKSGETYLETVEGMQFDRGYKSHYFVTDNNSMSAGLVDPLIFIADRRFTQVKELLPILNHAADSNKPLLIIAEDIDGEALATLIVNKMRGIIKVCAVKAPDFGDRRKLILEDIAIMTGGTVFSEDKGMKLDKFSTDWFGNSRVVNVTKEQTTIVDGKGTQEKIEARIEELKSQIEKSTTPFEIEKLQDRLAKFVGGVSIIHVGGNSELEMKEKKDRVDDALNAAKAAIEEGIIPGGGSALIQAKEVISWKNSIGDEKIGKQIVYKACSSPFKKILSNAGYTQEDIYKLMNKFSDKDKWKGYNLKTDKFVNMEEAGIIDPFKVCKNALTNASSVASTIILTEGVVVDKPESKKEPSFNPMEGMM